MHILEITPRIQADDYIELLGGRKHTDVSHALKGKLRIWKRRLNEIIEPKLLYSARPIKKVSRDSIHVGAHLKLHSQKLSRSLSGCKEVVCFLATLGSRVEKEIHRLMKKRRLSDAYVLDAMGSVAVENVVSQFQNDFGDTSRREDRRLSLRFSPGYCDWSVTGQKTLFELLDSKRVGVELSDSCLMQPRKSISGVFGVFPAEKQTDRASYCPCVDCGRRTCPERRHPGTKRKSE
jgi:hypothetical protein